MEVASQVSMALNYTSAEERGPSAKVDGKAQSLMEKFIESKSRIKNINSTIQVNAMDQKGDEIVSRLANDYKNIIDLIKKSNGKRINNWIKSAARTMKLELAAWRKYRSARALARRRSSKNGKKLGDQHRQPLKRPITT